MARTIQHKRGLEKNLPALKPGELAFTTDTKKVFVGSDTGNIDISSMVDLSKLATKETTDTLTEALDEVQNLVTNKAEKTIVDNALYHKRDKSAPIGLNDASPELLAAISGGEGTSFNIQSEPRLESVNAEKMATKNNFLIEKNITKDRRLVGYDTGTGKIALGSSTTLDICSFKMPRKGVLRIYADTIDTGQGMLITTDDGIALTKVLSKEQVLTPGYKIEDWLTVYNGYYEVSLSNLFNRYPTMTTIYTVFQKNNVSAYIYGIDLLSVDDIEWLGKGTISPKDDIPQRTISGDKLALDSVSLNEIAKSYNIFNKKDVMYSTRATAYTAPKSLPIYTTHNNYCVIKVSIPEKGILKIFKSKMTSGQSFLLANESGEAFANIESTQTNPSELGQRPSLPWITVFDTYFEIDIARMRSSYTIDIVKTIYFVFYATDIDNMYIQAKKFYDLENLEWLNVESSEEDKKEEYKLFGPEKVYTVSDVHNDLQDKFNSDKKRKMALPMYVDYLYPVKTGILFENQSDKYIFPDPYDYGYSSAMTGSEKSVSIPRTIKFHSDKYSVPDITINQIVTKLNAELKKAFVLCLGDSVTEDGMSGGQNYYLAATELFEKEAIDRNVTNTVKFLGARNVKKKALNYKNVTKEIVANAEGRSGWSLHNYLRHTSAEIRNQATWDYMGFGDGSGTDYVGSATQNTKIRKAVMNNASESVENFFFDNNKTGTNKFSINKWLERYRTLDDNGNRLTLGQGTGTQITAENLPNINVCTPTHIVVAMGHNDMESSATKGNSAEFRENIQELITAIRTELPNVILIFVVTPPLVGVFNKEKYPNYINIPEPARTYDYIDNAKWFINTMGKRESEKIYILPQYFVTPTAQGINTIKQTDGAGNEYYTPYGASLQPHPNPLANQIWGYQLYAHLKYLMTL